VLIFEWDPEKARENEQKHGVTFLEATEVFDDDHRRLFRIQITRPMGSDSSYSARPNRAGAWLCPILGAETASDDLRTANDFARATSL
jgi:hypothetical protein